MIASRALEARLAFVLRAGILTGVGLAVIGSIAGLDSVIAAGLLVVVVTPGVQLGAAAVILVRNRESSAGLLAIGALALMAISVLLAITLARGG